MGHHNEIGQQGEQAAVDYLIAEGFRILERNYVYLKREVDIIAKKDAVVHFIEVKTSEHWMHEEPHKSVGKAKQRNIGIAAEAFIEEFDLKEEVQFDIIEVRISPSLSLNYIPEAFVPRN